MRIKIGRIVNTDVEVNLADLSSIDRIIAAATNAYKNTSMYRRRYSQDEEYRENKKRKIRESLTDNILSVIYNQLDKSKLLEDRGDEPAGILVEIPPRFTPFLNEVVQSHEFDAYEMHIIPPNSVITRFCKPPYLLFITHRGG